MTHAEGCGFMNIDFYSRFLHGISILSFQNQIIPFDSDENNRLTRHGQ